MAVRKSLPELGLVFVYWAVRFHRLTALPAFFDEAVHIRWAKMAWGLVPFAAADEGRLLNILLYALFWPFTGALWISRAAYLLLGAFGFAALLGLGRLWLGRRAGLIAGGLYVVLPWAFFYERMALADPPAAALSSLVLWGSYFALRRAGWRPLLAASGLLFGLLITKFTAIVFVILPGLAWLFLAPRDGRWRLARRVARLYLTTLLPLAAFLTFIALRFDVSLGLKLILRRTEPAPLLGRLTAQTGALIGYIGAYLTWPALALFLLTVLLVFVRGSRPAGLLLTLIGLFVALPLTGSNVNESRFYVPILPAVALLCGWGAEQLVARFPARWGTPAAIGLAVVLALGGPAQFIRQSYADPSTLPLIAWDRFQYVEGWPAGYGTREAAAFILEKRAAEPLNVVLADEGHIPALSLYFGPEPRVRSVYVYSDPRLSLLKLPRDGDPWPALADPRRETFFVVERPEHAGSLASLRAQTELIAAYLKPGGRVVEIFRITPAR